MSRDLKLLAKELEIPVAALSQLNRVPSSAWRSPVQMSDLRDRRLLGPLLPLRRHGADVIAPTQKPDRPGLSVAADILMNSPGGGRYGEA
jgi:DnaB-like helicase C terminal domain